MSLSSVSVSFSASFSFSLPPSLSLSVSLSSVVSSATHRIPDRRNFAPMPDAGDGGLEEGQSSQVLMAGLAETIIRDAQKSSAQGKREALQERLLGAYCPV